MLLAAGCAKKADGTRSPASADGYFGDDIVALERQLAQREGELRAVGVAPAVAATATITAAPPRDGNDVVGDASASEKAGPAPASEAVASGAQSTPTEERSRQQDGGRCERVCEIAAAICSLEDQICGLVPRHRDDARYQAACDRSAADCQLANEACHACTP